MLNTISAMFSIFTQENAPDEDVKRDELQESSFRLLTNQVF